MMPALMVAGFQIVLLVLVVGLLHSFAVAVEPGTPDTDALPGPGLALAATAD